MLAKPPFECPQQRRADRRVVAGLYSVTDVALGKRTGGGQYGFKIAESVNDGRQDRHQHAALLFHITAKQWSDCRRYFEKSPVEQLSGLLGDGLDLQEAVLNRFHLVRRHNLSPCLRGRPFNSMNRPLRITVRLMSASSRRRSILRAIALPLGD